MAADRIVILGAGFGGLTVAEALDPVAGMGKADVTLVDRNAIFQMGFSMQWVFAGRRRPDEGERPYSALATRNVRFVHDEVAAIDPANRLVHTRSRRLPYDHLVLALGAELAPELVPGLGEGAYNLCDLGSVGQFRAALDSIEKGVAMIAIASTPFKCPPAPYEYAFLAHDILKDRGVRDKVRVVLTTPEPQPMPVAGKVVGEQIKAMMAERGIEYLPGHKPKWVDVRGRTVAYENGKDLGYDVVAAMYPHRAPKVVRDSGLADESGFVPVKLGTFRTSKEGVYAIGDLAAMKLPNGSPHPKAGVFAEAQGMAVARALASALVLLRLLTPEGRGVCFVDAGKDKAAPAEIHLLADGGPKASLEAPSVEGLMGKRKFERDRFLRWFGG